MFKTEINSTSTAGEININYTINTLPETNVAPENGWLED